MPGHMIGSPLDISPDPSRAAALAQAREYHRRVDSPRFLDGPEHVLVGQRAEGKTTLAVRWLLAAPLGIKRVLIVYDERIARNLKREHDLPADDDRIISFRSLTRSGGRRPTDPAIEYGIDDSVHVLAELLHLPAMPHLVTVGTAAPWQGTDAEE
ncbi:hypothetical protein EOG37_01225 [Clavibacter michiganensis subsp. michiganensis]|uniref:hypothetical protein n=1 Tax=Clavibacter michiganensis TaxID=28447 RepID=UPI001C651E36|nr:hypothetical protein [Clavibacter michiganensis]MBW8025301.1 hypothetical protein [Clavibacter michiganensis subsp. michiganensis]